MSIRSRSRARALAAAVTAAVAGGVVVTLPARAAAGCAPPAPGGEWREYSHDLSNSRNQPAETRIGPAEAANLTPRWVVDTARLGAAGEINHDPIVADGCVYLGTSGGQVMALNAATGALVWLTRLDDSLDDGFDHIVNSSPTVKDGKVYVHATRSADPRLVILDQRTGKLVRHVRLLAGLKEDQAFGTELISSPKVFDGKVFSGISGAGAESGNTFGNTPLGALTGFSTEPSSRLRFRGVYTITDEATGKVRRAFTIPDEDFAAGFSGGAVWSSPAVDQRTRYAYVGSGNPFSPREHPHTNALLKIDVDPRRPTFGRVVDTYKGTYDQYVDGVDYKPVCDAYVDVFTCETSDFDFGASPQLFTIGREQVVGSHQKSGVYHVAKRSDMSGVWKATVGAPFGWFGGEGTASSVDDTVVVPGNTPGLLSRLDHGTGRHRWVAPIADGIHFTSVTTANGVAYLVDTRGMLVVWELASGRQLAARQLGLELGGAPAPAFSTGHSVSVARNTVFVPIGGTVIAYHHAGGR